MHTTPHGSALLSAQELLLIENDLPDLKDWGNFLLVPFQGQRLKGARVLWLNIRWFCERQIDVTDEGIQQRVRNWLLSEFAFAVPSDGDSDAFSNQKKILYADRYGSNTGLFRHGGSGRSAVIGKFHVKGVGITPLAGEGVNRAHSHGCASLDVAIREVIYSEIAASEFPHGAIPVIALLDTGLQFDSTASANSPSRRLRRALIVRPAMIRPAHMQRAPAFLRSLTGYANSQRDDVQRVRDIISIFNKQSYITGGIHAELVKHFRRVVEQIAFGQMQRLYNGGYFSSNLTIKGELLDFGNMYAFGNWVNARVLDADAGFGKEMQVVRNTIKSLVFYLNKYLPKDVKVHESDLVTEAEDAYAAAFRTELLRLWHLDCEANLELETAVMSAVRQYYQSQQKQLVNYSLNQSSGHGWLYDSVVDSGHTDNREAGDDVFQTLFLIDHALRLHYGSSRVGRLKRAHSWMTGARFLSPRRSLDRGQLRSQISNIIATAALNTAPDSSEITHLISSSVGENRRHWRNLPRDVVVVAHAFDQGCSAVACTNLLEGKNFWWLEGIVIHNRLLLFSDWIRLIELQGFDVQYNSNYWNTLLPASDFSYLEVPLRGRTIKLPAMQMHYAAPASRWMS